MTATNRQILQFLVSIALRAVYKNRRYSQTFYPNDVGWLLFMFLRLVQGFIFMQKIHLLNVAAILGLSSVTACSCFFYPFKLYWSGSKTWSDFIRESTAPKRDISENIFFFLKDIIWVLLVMEKFNRLNFCFPINRNSIHKQHCVTISPNR